MKKGEIKMLPLLMLSAAAIVIILCVAFIFTGIVSVRINVSKNAKVVTSYRVCGNDTIKKYKDFYAHDFFDNKKFAKIVDEIRSKVDYQHDPSCQYIIFDYEVTRNDIRKAKEALDVLHKKANDGLYPDNNLSIGSGFGELDDRYKMSSGVKYGSESK